jgi:hypothetical protein
MCYLTKNRAKKIFKMKKILTLVFIIYIFESCSQKEEVLTNFGKAKIGMSVNDFFTEIIPEMDIDSSLIQKQNFKQNFKSLKVSENIILINANVEFKNSKLVYIEAENNQQLFEQLKKIFKIKKREEFGKIYIIEFNTNNKKTTCTVIGNGKKQFISLKESNFKGE